MRLAEYNKPGLPHAPGFRYAINIDSAMLQVAARRDTRPRSLPHLAHCSFCLGAGVHSGGGGWWGRRGRWRQLE
jgi:hypothetical protein